MFDRARFLAMLAGAAGGAIAIASMEAFSATTAFPLVAIPFATSIVTVLGSPKADPSQPRASIGGQLQPCSEHACGYKLANDGHDARALQRIHFTLMPAALITLPIF